MEEVGIMPITTMEQIDQARNFANALRDEAVAARDDVELAITKRARYEEALEHIEVLLAYYHEQRSPENLMRLLAHTFTDCNGLINYGPEIHDCPACEEQRALVHDSGLLW